MKLKLTVLGILLILLFSSCIMFTSGSTYPSTQSSEIKYTPIMNDDFQINANSNGMAALIIVENSLWASSAIKTAVAQYRQDLNLTGYKTILFTNAITNITYLKQILSMYYYSDNICGAVLIGSLPYAQFYHPASTNFVAENFICDLFLMDFDGTWMDTGTPDGYLDWHFGAPGDIYPEIFVSRIDASSRTLGGQSNEQNILSLLGRIHNYYTGGVSRTHQAITYIDDDWEAYANGTYPSDIWSNWLQNCYPTKTDVYNPSTTTASDWLNRITQDYEWAHLCVHSGQTIHYFGPGGSGEGTVTSTNIHNTRPTYNFYNLFCCKGADWRQNDCLATTYLFSSDYSLSVIATTKTGGMFKGNYFYNPLAQNKSIGQSFLDWFQGITSYGTSEYLEWFYGMTILGDPFLTINYDCTVFEPEISSSTHPNSYQWSTNNNPHFNWTVPIDMNGIVGYYYKIDKDPLTVPTSITGIYTTLNGTTITGLSDGVWYLHVVAKDGANNIGTTAAHYRVSIDISSPTITIDQPVDHSVLEPGNIELSWQFNDLASGYSHAEIRINNSLITTIYSPSLTYTANLHNIGTYFINITGYDEMSFSDSDQIQIEIYISPTTTNKFGIPIISLIVSGLIVLTISKALQRKRK